MIESRTTERIAERAMRSIWKLAKSLQPRLYLDHVRKNEDRIKILELLVDALIDRVPYRAGPETGFNGQLGRKRIFEEMLRVVDVQAIVETGTMLGDTTGYLAETSKLKVYTCDVEPRFLRMARTRLEKRGEIVMELSDSRSFLRKLSRTELVNQVVFFYLDAHWFEDLPLREELEIISSSWREFVVMIDDFKVPYDKGYGFDEYGRAMTLEMDLVADIIKSYDLVTYFPTVSSSAETGMKRGFVILVKNGPMSLKLGQVPSIQAYPRLP
jgi:hypothetical protein